MTEILNPLTTEYLGGEDMKVDLTRNVSLTLEQAKIPTNFGEETQITGTRHGRIRNIDLIPEDASIWLRKQGPQTLDHLMIVRFFPDDEAWSYALAALKNGGSLVTTGIGLMDPLERFTGGDIRNTPIPLNKDTHAIGLEPLLKHPDILFYRKVEHLPQPAVLTRLRENNALYFGK